MMDCMIDLETMGVSNSPAIVQLAAVAFDINTGNIISEFDVSIDLESSCKAGLDISPSTVKWWLNQDGDVRGKVFSTGVELTKALPMFSDWVQENNVKYIHGNGAASDCVWLRSAYEKTLITYPLSFREDMCYRTMRTLAARTGWKNNTPPNNMKHDGLSDAKYQVAVLMGILKHLGVYGKF